MSKKKSWKNWFVRTEYSGTDLNDINALILAGQSEQLSLALTSKPDLNSADSFGRLPLHFAVEKDRSHLISLLLEAGAQINQLDDQGNSALSVAAQHGAIESARKLFHLGVNYMQQNNTGKTALDIAIEKNDQKIIDLFIYHLKELKVKISIWRHQQAAKFSKGSTEDIEYDSIVGATRIQELRAEIALDSGESLPAMELEVKRLEKYLKEKLGKIP